MPRIHGPPQPHRPISSSEVGMGRGPNGHLVTPIPLTPTPLTRQSPDPKIFDFVAMINESKKRQKSPFKTKSFMPLGATEDTRKSAELSDGGKGYEGGMKTSSLLPCTPEDSMTPLDGFGSSDARDASTGRLHSGAMTNSEDLTIQLALRRAQDERVVCRTAEQACRGFEILSPTAASGAPRQSYVSNQKGDADMKRNPINPETWQNDDEVEMCDAILVDDDAFNSFVHSK